MFYVQFNAPRVVTYADPKAFDQQAKRWLSVREGENSYLLGIMNDLYSRGPQPGLQFFTVEEDKMISAAGVVMSDGTTIMSWATHEVLDALAEHLIKSNTTVKALHGPGHVAGYLGRMIAERTGQIAEVGRAERIYQLARNYYALPSQGHLEVATAADRPMVKEWVTDFVEEAEFELGTRSIDNIVDVLVGPRLLYLWKSPDPVSMAAWVAPTPHGASINFVYTPPEFRGQGYGKAVCAALAAQMLASGLRYCFILTDVDDPRTNALYQSIGARTLCEFTRCTITPRDSKPRSGINVVTSILL
jgi:uncharacterized protein